VKVKIRVLIKRILNRTAIPWIEEDAVQRVFKQTELLCAYSIQRWLRQVMRPTGRVTVALGNGGSSCLHFA
jgi:hypothetical protein